MRRDLTSSEGARVVAQFRICCIPTRAPPAACATISRADRNTVPWRGEKPLQGSVNLLHGCLGNQRGR